MYTKLLANCVTWFQWIKDIKQKKKEEKQKEMVVSFWQRLLWVDSFPFWLGFCLSHLGTAAFKPSLKQVTQK